jgi:formylglycine-generating enzyme required for sulfatase activity
MTNIKIFISRILLIFLFILLFSCTSLKSQVNTLNDTIIFINNSVYIELVQIPEGKFLMGSPEDEEGRGADEGPVHEVILGYSYYIGKYEVTQKLWQAIMGTNPAVFKLSPDHPVESVSWNDCKKFIESLNKLGKGTFRFPSEAEWEYACRAGTTTPYYWGESMEDNGWSEYAWANSRSGAMTHPVGEKKPNPWGLYDMAGNVWEWCSDDYEPYMDTAHVITAGESTFREMESSTLSEKVFRGGSWFDFRESHRCANRHRHRVDKGYTAIGLRLVWEEGLEKRD